MHLKGGGSGPTRYFGGILGEEILLHPGHLSRVSWKKTTRTSKIRYMIAERKRNCDK
jgi:hypothetical protein